MRVAFVSLATHHRLDTAPTRRIDRTARQVAAHEDHDAVVCCACWWDGGTDTFVQDGLRYAAVTDERAPRRFAARLPLALRQERPDIVHASYWPPAAAAGAIAAGRLTRTPVALDWYGDEPVDGTARLSAVAARRAGRVLVPSRYVATVVRELDVDRERTRVIPESIDVDRIRSVTADRQPDIVAAARLDGTADVEAVLLALAELRDRAFDAVILGAGPRRSAHAEQAAALGIDDRVSFPGWPSCQERIAWYTGAHTFVQPPGRCPFATELLRALACGCAAVVEYRADSAAHELVEQLDRGVRITDREAWPDAIVDAAALDHLTYNDRFDRYDHARIREAYLETYRRLRDG